jgi:hypothetical protein
LQAIAWLALAACAQTCGGRVEPVRPPVAASESAPPALLGAQAPAEGALECRARHGDSTYELFLVWDGNLARGTLRKTGAGAMSWSVTAELYKGLVLVGPKGAQDPNARIATVNENGDKTMQVGDWKQPWLPCE